MADKTRENVTRILRQQLERTLKAAGGEPINPQTLEPTNAARAERVDAFVRMYADLHYRDGIEGEELATIVQDFITDALHWGVQHEDTENVDDQFDPTDVAMRAANMTEDELRAEATTITPEDK